jgi:hypothetical protein
MPDRALRYVAPDLELLTSGAFAKAHCFVVREDEERPGMIGLEFRPDPLPPRADVRGTLWLTRETLELRALDFAYTGVRFSGPDSLAGGRVEFARLANGAFVPTAWAISGPIPPDAFLDALGRRRARERAGDAPLPISRLDPTWASQRVVVTGGTVQAVRSVSDSLSLWRRAPGDVEVTVRWRRGARAAARGARVLLTGLGAEAYTDENGQAMFRNVPPGQYVVATTSEEQEFLQLPRDERLAVVRSGATTRVALTALPADLAVNSVCEFNRGDAVLAGIATRDGRGTSGARIRIATVEADARGRERLNTIRTGWSGGAGLYHICRLPRGADYVVTAAFPGGAVARARVSVPTAQPGMESPALVRLDLMAESP